MPHTSTQKPLLLIFPHAQLSQYNRCLVLANHLRVHFTVQFLHNDSYAYLLYEQGFDTFTCSSFPHLNTFYKEINAGEDQIEKTFLEQVQVLERMQPAVVIGDGIATLSMACEYTGVPYISLINGYQSPFYINENSLISVICHTPYQIVREQFDLRPKEHFIEELQGDLNWICDLPDLYPQRELPFNYEIIGPLYGLAKQSTTKVQNSFQNLKKTIYLEINQLELKNKLTLVDDIFSKRYNLIHSKKSKAIPSLKAFQKEINIYDADLVICDSEDLMYEALQHSIPVLLISEDVNNKCSVDLLEQWHLGVGVKEFHNHFILNDLVEYWINRKDSDEHRSFQYQLNRSTLMLLSKLENSISIQFPFVKWIGPLQSSVE